MKVVGDGLRKEVVVNEPVKVTLDTKGAGDAKLNFVVYDSDHKPVETAVVDNKDGTYTYSFKPKKCTKHVACATFGEAIVAKFPHIVCVL